MASCYWTSGCRTPRWADVTRGLCRKLLPLLSCPPPSTVVLSCWISSCKSWGCKGQQGLHQQITFRVFPCWFLVLCPIPDQFSSIFMPSLPSAFRGVWSIQPPRCNSVSTSSGLVYLSCWALCPSSTCWTGASQKRSYTAAKLLCKTNPEK